MRLKYNKSKLPNVLQRIYWKEADDIWLSHRSIRDKQDIRLEDTVLSNFLLYRIRNEINR